MAGCRYDGTCTQRFGNDSRQLPRSHDQIHDHELAPFINKKWWTHLGKLLYLSSKSWTQNRGTHGLFFNGSKFKAGFFHSGLVFYLSRSVLETAVHYNLHFRGKLMRNILVGFQRMLGFPCVWMAAVAWPHVFCAVLALVFVSP